MMCLLACLLSEFEGIPRMVALGLTFSCFTCSFVSEIMRQPRLRIDECKSGSMINFLLVICLHMLLKNPKSLARSRNELFWFVISAFSAQFLKFRITSKAASKV